MRDSIILKELKSIITNKKILIPIIAILVIPILYAGMFLWAFWDPYDYLAALPVAIVNEDEGATFEEEHLELGNELIDKLKEEADFDFHFVDPKEGYEDLVDQKYYVLIKVPKDFSENATTLLDDSPKKLELVYMPNESFNFLSAQIGETAMLQIEATLEEKVIETYAETMFDKIDEISDGFAEASDGAHKLFDGSSDLSDGSKKLDDGAHDIKDGANTLKDHLKTLAESSVTFEDGTSAIHAGANELAGGIGDLSQGLNELSTNQVKLKEGAEKVSAGASEIVSGTAQTKDGLKEVSTNMNGVIGGTDELAKGAKQLVDGMNELSGSTGELSAGAAGLHQGITGLDKQLQPLLNNLPAEQKDALQGVLNELQAGSKKLSEGTSAADQAVQKMAKSSTSLPTGLDELKSGQVALKNGIDQLYDGSIQLNNGATELSSGQTELVSGLSLFQEKLSEAANGSNLLVSGANELRDGTNELVNGSRAFVDGTNELSSGSSTLADGASELADGTTTLADGSKELVSGSNELADELKKAADETSDVHAGSNTYEMMSNPVEVDAEPINEVPNYGTGFSPYFLSLGLFVGALLLSIVYPLREPASTPKNSWSWFLSKFTPLLGVGVLQALIAAGMLLFALGLEVQSIPLFLFFAIITSITYIALIQFFVTCFGDPGRFIAILILILQLTTSAGTFPLELIPNTLQYFNAFLPMTYTVQGFKAVISSGDFSAMWTNVWILLGFTSIFIIGSISYFFVMYKRKYEVLSKTETTEDAI